MRNQHFGAPPPPCLPSLFSCEMRGLSRRAFGKKKGREDREGETLRSSTELCWRRCVFSPLYFLCCLASLAPVTVACVSLWLLWPSRSFQQQQFPAGIVASSVAQDRIWEPTSCSPSSRPGAHVSSQGQHQPAAPAPAAAAAAAAGALHCERLCGCFGRVEVSSSNSFQQELLPVL